MNLNAKEQQLFDSELGATTVRMQVRTRTLIDVGLWWRRRPLWLCVTGGELVLLAVARRRYCERVSLAACREVLYNPASGELVISSDPPLRFPRLKMPPSTALEVLDLIRSTAQAPAATTDS